MNRHHPQPFSPREKGAGIKVPLPQGATVYTDLDLDCKFTDLAPLTPQF